MNKRNITNILFGLAIAVLLFGAGFKLGEFKSESSQIQSKSFTLLNVDADKAKKAKFDFALFWETVDLLEKKYVDKKKLDPQKMFYGALKGMVASVDDPYTFFLTPEDNKQSKADLGGRFEGIGASLGLANNRIVVIAPIKGSPAEKAGVRAGDYIQKVDGKVTKNWSLPQAVSKIRGKKGTKVKLGLLRVGSPKEIEVSIVRDEIKVISVETSFDSLKSCKSNCRKVAVVKVTQFGENTNQEWDEAVATVLQEWNKKTISGLVIDMRDNPGGFLDSAVYLSSEFLPLGKLIVKQESTVNPSRTYTVDRKGSLLDVPVSILINQGSASASEIFSGALRDHKRADLIGIKSFGKGSVQEALDLKGGAGIHVTIAKWILPGGEWINGKGIEPKYPVANVIPEGNTLTRELDAQLEKAIEVVLQ